MARFCITPIILQTNPNDEEGNRAAIVAAADTVRAIIPTDQQGHPIWRFAACRFEAVNMAAAAQVSNTYILPDYPLDGLLGGMDAATRTAMVQSVQAFDLDGNGTHISLAAFGDSSRYRDVVEHIAKTFEAIQWLDVPNA